MTDTQTTPFCCHLLLTFVQFGSLDYCRKEVTGSHLPSLLFFLQNRQFELRLVRHKHSITVFLYINFTWWTRKVLWNNWSQVMDKSERDCDSSWVIKALPRAMFLHAALVWDHPQHWHFNDVNTPRGLNARLRAWFTVPPVFLSLN